MSNLTRRKLTIKRQSDPIRLEQSIDSDNEPVTVQTGTPSAGETIDWAAYGKAQPTEEPKTVYELRNEALTSEEVREPFTSDDLEWAEEMLNAETCDRDAMANAIPLISALLFRLNYTAQARVAILDEIRTYRTVEGCAWLSDAHRQVIESILPISPEWADPIWDLAFVDSRRGGRMSDLRVTVARSTGDGLPDNIDDMLFIGACG